MSYPISLTKTLAAADSAIIAANQTLAGAGDMALVGGGIVTLDTGRQVLLTFAADETGHNFTIYGYESTSGSSAPISEVIAGTTAGTVVSTRMYGQITRIAVSAANTGNVKAGTNGVGATPWLAMNYQYAPFVLSIAAIVTGTVNYTIQYTYDDPFMVVPGTTQGIVPTAFSDPILAAATATGETTFNNPITGMRLLINSGSGSITLRAIQAGISGR